MKTNSDIQELRKQIIKLVNEYPNADDVMIAEQILSLLESELIEAVNRAKIVEINRMLHRLDPSKPASRHSIAYLKARKDRLQTLEQQLKELSDG